MTVSAQDQAMTTCKTLSVLYPDIDPQCRLTDGLEMIPPRWCPWVGPGGA